MGILNSQGELSIRGSQRLRPHIDLPKLHPVNYESPLKLSLSPVKLKRKLVRRSLKFSSQKSLSSVASIKRIYVSKKIKK